MVDPLSTETPAVEPQSTAPQVVEPIPQPVIIQQPPVQPPHSTVQETPVAILPTQLPQRSVSQPPQPIPTQETRVFDNTNTARSQPASVVVEITNPWEDKCR